MIVKSTSPPLNTPARGLYQRRQPPPLLASSTQRGEARQQHTTKQPSWTVKKAIGACIILMGGGSLLFLWLLNVWSDPAGLRYELLGCAWKMCGLQWVAYCLGAFYLLVWWFIIMSCSILVIKPERRGGKQSSWKAILIYGVLGALVLLIIFHLLPNPQPSKPFEQVTGAEWRAVDDTISWYGFFIPRGGGIFSEGHKFWKKGLGIIGTEKWFKVVT